jgi:hypothetical protein
LSLNVATHVEWSSSATPTRPAGMNASRQDPIGHLGAVAGRSSSSYTSRISRKALS